MKRPYKQLNLEERRKIEKWRAAKISVDMIAERLGRGRSIIFQELRCNHFTDAERPKVVGYFGVVASMKALSRRQKDRKLMRHTELRELTRRLDTGTNCRPFDLRESAGSGLSGNNLSLRLFA